MQAITVCAITTAREGAWPFLATAVATALANHEAIGRVYGRMDVGLMRSYGARSILASAQSIEAWVSANTFAGQKLAEPLTALTLPGAGFGGGQAWPGFGLWLVPIEPALCRTLPAVRVADELCSCCARVHLVQPERDAQMHRLLLVLAGLGYPAIVGQVPVPWYSRERPGVLNSYAEALRTLLSVVQPGLGAVLLEDWLFQKH